MVLILFSLILLHEQIIFNFLILYMKCSSRLQINSLLVPVLVGESHVYTVGRIGNHMCVSTKLSRVGGSRGATIAAGNSVTRLLGVWNTHVFRPQNIF